MYRILVTGGAGYIGSHMVKLLVERGHAVCTLDDLSGGHRNAVLGGDFVQGSIGDGRLLDRLFQERRFDAVMHFASFIQVGESVRDPAKYYANNVANTITLLNAMARARIGAFVFSSSAAIFGDPEACPVAEDHPVKPLNPYGLSKWAVERMLGDYDHAYGMKSACLRYFNAAGAHPDGLLGERHEPESHLIPLVLQAASGRRPSIDVYGHDYPTPDGTCVRDYIHVVDLCDAHLLALDLLLSDRKSGAFNLGNGDGYSVQQVLDVAGRVTGKRIKANHASRRPGDAARLVADSALARKQLGWQPRYAGLAQIISHAWAWEQKLASGAER